MSSKKHKHDREHKRKHKHRSPSRSRSRSPQREVKRTIREEEPAKQQASNAGGDVSLSIEETNKLRVEIGLKPLEISGADKGGTDEDGQPKKDFVHVPAKNISEAIKIEAIKEKIATHKEKRKMLDKVAKTKTLGDSSGEEDDAAKWVEKMRRQQREKALAEERAKKLAEMDEAFGVSDLVAEEFQRDRHRETHYGSRDLSGLNVEHNVNKFREGQTIILTLKDKGVLDDDEEDETLINVNIADDERAEKNIANKLNAPGYKAYDDEEAAEADALASMKLKGILSKYDAEIDGEKKTSFQLGSGGLYNAEHEKALQRMREDALRDGQRLDTGDLRLASDFYTTDEMNAKFKKRKKKVRRTPRQALNADDLLVFEDPTSGLRTATADHRSRKKRHVDDDVDGEDLDVQEESASDLHGRLHLHMDEPAYQADDDEEEWSRIVLDPDEAQEELQSALSKIRKIKQKKKSDISHQGGYLEDVFSKHVPEEGEAREGAEGGPMVLNALAEFCKSIGDLPSEALSGRPRRDMGDPDEDMDIDADDDYELGRDGRDAGGGWQEVEAEDALVPVDLLSRSRGGEGSRDMQRGVLDDEPQLDQGLGVALVLAQKKGYIDRETNSQVQGARLVNLSAKNFIQEDVRYDDIDAKFSKRDRFSGPLSDFKDKSNYKPNVKLEYVDEGGRQLSTKEAFRQLSHSFHGKGSGKMKTEKRMKKIDEDILMRTMSSSDTPLGTADKLHKKLEKEGVPYVVLSGKNASVNKIAK